MLLLREIKRTYNHTSKYKEYTYDFIQEPQEILWLSR